MKQIMKKLIFFILLSCFCTIPCAFGDSERQAEKTEQAESTDDTTENKAGKKEAEKWLKNHITKSKKILAALKKIKDPKSCKRSAKSIKKLGYKNLQDRDALEKEVDRLNTPAMRVAIKKYSKTLEKLNDQIGKEVERINNMVVEYEELNNAYDSMGLEETVSTIMLLTSKLLLHSKFDDKEENDSFGG